jgi:hypothetical protein
MDGRQLVVCTQYEGIEIDEFIGSAVWVVSDHAAYCL